MDMLLTEEDKAYIEKFKSKLAEYSWTAKMENNTYYVTCDSNTRFINKQASWLEMKEQFFQSLVNKDDTYHFVFHRKQNASLEKPFDSIYNPKVSPWLVAHMLSIIDKTSFSLQYLLLESIHNFNVDIISECLAQKFDYKIISINQLNSKRYYAQFDQVCHALLEVVKHNPNYQEKLSEAFVKNIVASELHTHITDNYLLTQYNKIFGGKYIPKILKALDIQFSESAINQEEEITLSTFKINHTIALSKNFAISHLEKIIKFFPYKTLSFPKMHLLETNSQWSTIAVENTMPYAKEMAINLFNSMIEGQYEFVSDYANNLIALNSMTEKVKLELNFHHDGKHNVKTIKL
jgi:hypothetical protein